MGTPTFKTRNTVRAKALRNAATPHERRLWNELRSAKTGHKFSRQMPVGPFFADFLCRELNLIIELDGVSHDLTQEADARRTAWLEEGGYRIIRFANDEVMRNLEGVMIVIAGVLAQLSEAHPQPLPQAGGEQMAS